MSNNIKAGVVLKTKFVSSVSNKFGAYIDYINRDSASRNENIDKYSCYTDYMDNPEKTENLFTATKDRLNDQEKKQLKNIFKTAQNNGSLMWQSVISFDMNWLEKQGLYNKQNNQIDSNRIMDVTRNAMKRFLQSENLYDSAVYSAAIHYNTEHIHVHIATVEPYPTRPFFEFKGQNSRRGKVKQSSLDATKSNIINDIMDTRKENELINGIIRQSVLKQMNKKINNDKIILGHDLKKKYKNIYKNLPKDRRLWNYNMNAMKDVRPLIDDFNNSYLKKYHNDDMEKLQSEVNKLQEKYAEAYGDSNKGNRFAQNKMDDVYVRMGNTLLKSLKQYDKDLKKAKNHSSNSKSNFSRIFNKGISNAGAGLSADREHYKNMQKYMDLQREEEEELEH